ncbi:hypothetical protein NKG05_14240 [Oerskovia sp. M15]
MARTAVLPTLLRPAHRSEHAHFHGPLVSTAPGSRRVARSGALLVTLVGHPTTAGSGTTALPPLAIRATLGTRARDEESRTVPTSSSSQAAATAAPEKPANGAPHPSAA